MNSRLLQRLGLVCRGVHPGCVAGRMGSGCTAIRPSQGPGRTRSFNLCCSLVDGVEMGHLQPLRFGAVQLTRDARTDKGCTNRDGPGHLREGSPPAASFETSMDFGFSPCRTCCFRRASQHSPFCHAACSVSADAGASGVVWAAVAHEHVSVSNHFAAIVPSSCTGLAASRSVPASHIVRKPPRPSITGHGPVVCTSPLCEGDFCRRTLHCLAVAPGPRAPPPDELNILRDVFEYDLVDMRFCSKHIPWAPTIGRLPPAAYYKPPATAHMPSSGETGPWPEAIGSWLVGPRHQWAASNRRPLVGDHGGRPVLLAA